MNRFMALICQDRGAPHPCREEILAAYPHTAEASRHWIDAAAAPVVFCKHIAYHFMEQAQDVDQSAPWFYDWIANHRHFLLIRDPRRMVASFKNKYDDVVPIAQSYAVARRIYDFLSERGAPCPIIDAQDMLAAPEPMLRALCDVLDIPFHAGYCAGHAKLARRAPHQRRAVGVSLV